MRVALTRVNNLSKMDRDHSRVSSTDAKKSYCSFDDPWLKEHRWLSKKDEFTATSHRALRALPPVRRRI